MGAWERTGTSGCQVSEVADPRSLLASLEELLGGHLLGPETMFSIIAPELKSLK